MTCTMRPYLDLYLAGQARPELEHALTAHVPTCDECRAYYESMIASAQLAQEPTRPVEEPEPFFVGMLKSALAVVLALAALAAFYIIPDFEPAVARGPATRLSARTVGPVTQIEPYRVRPDGSRLELGLEMFADDRLGFTILNTGDYSRVLVFALDDGGGIYWLYPDWTDRSKTMFAPPVLKSSQEQDVPPGTHRDWEGQVLTLFMIFSKDMLSLRDVEERLRDPGRDTKQNLFPGSLQKTRAIKLVRIDPSAIAEEKSAEAADGQKTDELWPSGKPAKETDPKTPHDESLPVDRTAPLRPLVISPFGPAPEAPTLDFGASQ